MAGDAVQGSTHDRSGCGSEKPTKRTRHLKEQDATDDRTHHPIPKSLVPHGFSSAFVPFRVTSRIEA
jgi:hypothetical protein